MSCCDRGVRILFIIKCCFCCYLVSGFCFEGRE
jgi:hypothetical protein